MRSLPFLCVMGLVLALAAPAVAQFQSCVYCDVEALNPDPFLVYPCETNTIILTGIGFVDTGVNGCTSTPEVAVRTTRPDRVQILNFRVLDDGSIEVEYHVPCNASQGLVGIDVTIDDNPSDAIEPYACGNARMRVEELVLAVEFGDFGARRTEFGVMVSWATLSEIDSFGFLVEARDGDGHVITQSAMVSAKGSPSSYSWLDDGRPALDGLTEAYRIIELDLDGISEATTWFPVELATIDGRAGRARLRAQETGSRR